jgi:hypothetical protein
VFGDPVTFYSTYTRAGKSAVGEPKTLWLTTIIRQAFEGHLASDLSFPWAPGCGIGRAELLHVQREYLYSVAGYNGQRVRLRNRFLQQRRRGLDSGCSTGDSTWYRVKMKFPRP